MTYSILIVDDDMTIRNLYRMVLQNAGYVVDEVTNGAEALKFLISHTPDVIIMDMLMPLLGGEAVIRRIRQMPALQDVKIVVVTAYPRFVKSAEFPQADRFLVKPVQADEFLDTIQAVLSQ
ncbi:MAG: response regulator [Chloroflexi bacterium]|nr:MAG: response regulator [Chloroflexota bacterium]